MCRCVAFPSTLRLVEEARGEDRLDVLLGGRDGGDGDEPSHARARGDGGDELVELLLLEADGRHGLLLPDGDVPRAHEVERLLRLLGLARQPLEDLREAVHEDGARLRPAVAHDARLDEREPEPVGEVGDVRGERVLEGVRQVQQRLVERHARDGGGVHEPVPRAHVVGVREGDGQVAGDELAHLRAQRDGERGRDERAARLHHVVHRVDGGVAGLELVRRLRQQRVVDRVVGVDGRRGDAGLDGRVAAAHGRDREHVHLRARARRDVHHHQLGALRGRELLAVQLLRRLLGVLQHHRDGLARVARRPAADRAHDKVVVVLLAEQLRALVDRVGHRVRDDLVVHEVRDVLLLQHLLDGGERARAHVRALRADEPDARRLQVVADRRELGDGAAAKVAALRGAVLERHHLVDVESVVEVSHDVSPFFFPRGSTAGRGQY